MTQELRIVLRACDFRNTADEISDKPWGHRSFSVIDPLGITVVLYSVISAPA